MAAGSRKRLFIGLISASCLLLCVFLVLLWVIPFIGLRDIHPAAPWALGLAVLAMVVLVCWSAAGLVLNILFGRTLPFTRSIRGVTVRLFLPLMTLVGRLLGLDKSRIRSSFISVNNEQVLAEAGRYAPREILLLMPHCLQNSRCDMRLSYNIDNCKRCGLCPIAGLLELRDHYGVHLAVATGGTIARRIVVQARPKIILAVACERDLASGIQDTYPLPVYGVLNERPNGPCLDTQVNLPLLEESLLRFLLPELGPRQTLFLGRDNAKLLRFRRTDADAAAGETNENAPGHGQRASNSPQSSATESTTTATPAASPASDAGTPAGEARGGVPHMAATAARENPEAPLEKPHE